MHTTTSRRKPGRQESARSTQLRSRQRVIALTIVASLATGFTILIYSGALGSALSKKGNNSRRDTTVSVASFDPNSPSKEYVYAGGRLVATEEPMSTCSYSLPSLSSAMLAAGGQSGVTFSVNASLGCAWTASTSDVWITITGGSGSGNGTVTYSVSNNSQSQRSGTITVTGTATGVQLPYTVNQAGTSCSYSLPSSSSAMLPAGGQSGVTFAVNATAGCAWTTSTSDGWITITGGSGSGNGTVTYSVSNNSQSQRSGTITVTGTATGVTLPYIVNQAGTSCSYSLPSSSSATLPAIGQTGVTFSVSATAGCAWTASTSDGWITITGGSGSGNGTVTYSVSANGSQSQRSGTITVTGTGVQLPYTVNQGYGSRISPVSATASNQLVGNEASKAIDGNLNTWWSAGNLAPQWIQLDLGQAYSITEIRANTAQYPDGVTNHEIYGGPQSTGLSLLRVLNGYTTGGQWLQADFSPAASNVRFIKINTTSSPSWVAWAEIEVYGSGCAYSLNKTSQQFVAAGGTDSVSVTAGTGCNWTASTSYAWITITSGQSGSGNGSVGYSVSANTGPARSGTITIAGQTFTVNQDSGCSFTINPTSASYPSSGGAGSLSVTANNQTCPWTAVNNNPEFITITSGSSGTGNGTVNYTVASNSGGARNGSINIASHLFTVSQDGVIAGCQVTTFSGSGAAGYAEGSGTSAIWNNPVSCVAAKSPTTGNPNAVFIADTTNSRIRMIYINGASAGTSILIAGDGTAGYSELPARYNHPQGLTAITDANGVAQTLLIADTDNHIIRKLAWNGFGWTSSTFSGTAGSGPGYVDSTNWKNCRYNGPQGIVAASSTVIYLADTGNSIIRKLTSTGTSSTQATGGQIMTPVGVAVTASDAKYLIVSDTGKHDIWEVYTASGTSTKLAGSDAAGFADGTGSGASFNSPRHLVYISGTIYIADRNNQRIRKLIEGTSAVTTLAGSGTAGNANGACGSATFNNPCGVGYGPSGEVYVMDSQNNLVRKVQP